jgi:hypothetical protein
VTRSRLIAELGEQNPRRDLPMVPAAADMLELVRDLAQPNVGSPRIARTSHRRRALIALLVPVAAVAIWLANLGSNTSLNVIAAAYAATSPGVGALEMTYEARSHIDGHSQILIQTTWLDSATGRARERVRLSGGHGWETVDRVRVRGWNTTWSSGDPGVLVREHSTVRYDIGTSWSIGGLQVAGIGGVQLFRSLYRAGRLRLAGRDAAGNWTLESTPTGAGGKRVKLVVSVDPHTFIPRSQELITVAAEHPAVLARARMLTYDELAASSIVSTFDLSFQHPHAKIVTRRGAYPVFVRLGHRRPKR